MGRVVQEGKRLNRSRLYGHFALDVVIYMANILGLIGGAILGLLSGNPVGILSGALIGFGNRHSGQGDSHVPRFQQCAD